MSKRVKLAFALAAAAAFGAALLIPACESVPLTAAPGTTMTLTANPTFVIANGGVSVVSAILVEPAGTFVPDGTEVFFFTNLGRVDESGKSRNGVVRVNFVSDARSGTATVTGISGGPAPSPPTTPTTTVVAARPGVTASSTTVPRVFGASDIASAENSGSIDIKIGNALPKRVVITANPQVLAKDHRSSTIVANVYDGDGNPVQNVPIIFTAQIPPPPAGTTAPALTEVLASGGVPRYTDANGQAFDTLTSLVASGELSKTVTVTATPPVGDGDTVDITIFYKIGK